MSLIFIIEFCFFIDIEIKYFVRLKCLLFFLSRFRIDNTDHIIDVNKNNLPFEYDQVNIICPVYPHSNQGTKTEEEEDEETERYIIYNVSGDFIFLLLFINTL